MNTLTFVSVILAYSTLLNPTAPAIVDKRLSRDSGIVFTIDSDVLNNTYSIDRPHSSNGVIGFVPITNNDTSPRQNLKISTSAPVCNLSQRLIDEIAGYKQTATRIFEAILSGSFKGKTYDDLSFFVDKFGSRVAGSKNLEDSIDYMLSKMVQDGLENVHGEEVTIPHWVRGEETAELIQPRHKKLALLGLGYSVGTPPEGITAEVLVVRSFDDLRNQSAKATGKIIVYNEDYVNYGETVKYRGQGASEAAKYGAVASLIRSIAPYSINSPHTGMQTYQPNVTKIPTACITIEDAQLLQRLQNRGEKLVITLKMNDTTLPDTVSRNVIGEIRGREKPEEVVVVSGHIDSWDVGQGAMDDGGGMIISQEALALLRFLELRPRRTLRSILWTTEEFGLIGVQQYIKQHAEEMNNFVTVFESDIGTFRPVGLDFSGTDDAGCILQEVLKLLSPVNATEYRKLPEVGSDIGYFIEKGVPGVSLNTERSKYFWYHHSEGDTMTVENSDELDLCTAVWTVASYVIADLSVTLPRG